MKFNSKVAVVTGAGSGIGRAVAVELAARGARLALSDIEPLGLAHTADLVAGQGAPVHTATLDVSSRGAVAEYATAVLAHYGAVDIVVNNAGIAGDSGTFVNSELDGFQRILDVNLWGVINNTKAFLPSLIASGDGHLVNISSINGIVAQPGTAAYCTSKFAVRGFTESVRADMVASGLPVRVTVVHPGGVSTDIANSAFDRAGSDVTPEQRKRLETYNDKLLRMPSEKAAGIIVDGIATGRSRVLVGHDARLLDVVARIVPARIPVVTAWFERRMFGVPAVSDERSASASS
ncbi:SDR family NAD(P)-dependent oxidoreductase [Williamsia sterculiae]|uniref:Short-chain dehydrogenase n=1 Tax=Williamsia sterculiae TaxID=1344003 RepID=A0A1N7EX62_9NOCA|nr:SDR family NAD(P)-dependent oxidoreductase [Williamsia sterculiae]SIR92666.1 Short-chain dehydrogenase [Williamsia sterculiae]